MNTTLIVCKIGIKQQSNDVSRSATPASRPDSSNVTQDNVDGRPGGGNTPQTG